METIIEDLGLTEEQVRLIVLQWYQGYNGMCPYILQDEDGNDLEEILEQEIFN